MQKISLILVLFLSCVLKAQPPGCSSGKDVLGNTGQAGLIGEYVAGYFSDNTSYFTSTVSATRRVESNLNYTTNNWGAIVPPAGGTVADADNYSSRYRGSIYIATGGIYTFYLTSDDGSWMWIDNDAIVYPTSTANAIINNGGLHGDITVSATRTLTAGLHNIQIQFGEQAGGNHLIFEYSATSPSITRQVVPNGILCTSIQPSITPVAAAAPPGCPCSAGVTSEFYTNYFNDVQTFFTSNSPSISRTDPQIAFTTDGGWGNVCPPLAGSNASPETFSTRFTGRIYIPVATTYTFYLTSDDASYMWLDGNALATNPTTASAFINDGGLHSATTVNAVATLSVGLHDFKIHYGENTGNNICYLEYASTGAGIGRQYVPQTSLCSCLSTFSTLPIELLNFAAVLNKNNHVVLNWTTASEVNNKQFDIERSNNGIDFETIATVAAKGNRNGASSTFYEYTDFSSLSGIAYYRLKQIDLDGSSKLYKIVSVESLKSSSVEFKVFPNPNSGSFTLFLGGMQDHRSAEILICMPDGRPVYEQQLLNGDLTESTEIKLELNLIKGIYIATCIVDGVRYPVKMLVN